MQVKNVFGVFEVEQGNVVRFTYHDVVRQGSVEYVRLTKEGKAIVNLICGEETDTGFKSYRVDRMQSAIETM
jgi:hypothetical protein